MKKNITILCLTLIIIPLSARAFSFKDFFDDLEEWLPDGNNNSQIINEVNVSTNTGNNVINGEIKEGGTKSQIYVKNIINGEEIDPIEIESEANEVKVESKIEVEDNRASVQREIEVDSGKSTENYEVDLKGSTDQEPVRTNLQRIRSWWLNFFDALTASLENIFSIFSK